MSIECRCEPCPFDIRTLGYETCKEDAAFEGTQCLWHEQIRGRKNNIFVAGGTAENPVFSVDYDGEMPTFGIDQIYKYAKADAAACGIGAWVQMHRREH